MDCRPGAFGGEEMKFVVPQSVDIGAHPHSIILSKQLEDGNYYGKTFHVQQILKINPSASETQKVGTLIHELLHCVSEIYTADLDEKQTRAVAEGLTQIVCEWGLELDWGQIKEE